MSTLAPTAKPFKPGCVPDTIPELSSETKPMADDSTIYDTLSDVTESNSDLKILPAVRFSREINSHLWKKYSFLSRIIIISVSNSLSEENRRRLAASPQVIELLHIYLTSTFPFFSGRKMPTLANKAKRTIKLGIIPDIPANDGLNTEMSYDSDISDSSDSDLFEFSFLDKRKPQVLISQIISVKCIASQDRKSIQVKPQIVDSKFLILLILPLVAVKVSWNRGSSLPSISPPAKHNRYPPVSKDHEGSIPSRYFSRLKATKETAASQPVDLKFLILLILPRVVIKVSLNSSSSPSISPPEKNRNQYPLGSKDHEDSIPSRYLSRLKATKETAASASIAEAQADKRAAIAEAYSVKMAAKLERIRNRNALLNRGRIQAPAAEPATPARTRSATQAKPGRSATPK